MDYEQMSYAEAKQLIKVAQPPAPAPAADSSWLSDLPGKFQASYADNPLAWQMGIGGLGGAGLGALSSLWQPKRRKNMAGRALTGGLLGALAGGAFNLAQGANRGFGNEKALAELKKQMDAAKKKLEGASDVRSIYSGDAPLLERLQRGAEGLTEGKFAPAGEALRSAPGVESAGEDISSVLAGESPQYNYFPEVAGLAGAAVHSRFGNRATGIGGGRGPLVEQMKRDVGKLTPAVPGSDIDAAIKAEVTGRQAAGSRNPLKKKFWTGTTPEAYQHLRHGSRARRVLKGSGTLRNTASDAWSPYYGGAKQNLKATRGGKLKRGGKFAAIAAFYDLLMRGGLESDPVSGRGAARTRAGYLNSQDAVRRAEAAYQQNASKYQKALEAAQTGRKLQ